MDRIIQKVSWLSAGFALGLTCSLLASSQEEGVDLWGKIRLDSLEGPYQDWDLKGPDTQWVYASGRWVVHPPLEFAEQMLGEELINTCTQALEEGAQYCKVDGPDCTKFLIFDTGNIQFDISASSCLGDREEQKLIVYDRDPETRPLEIRVPIR